MGKAIIECVEGVTEQWAEQHGKGKDHRKGEAAKATFAGVSRSTVSRGDTLANHRPDLAEKVRLGELRPAAAHRQMKNDSVAERVAALAPTD